MVERVVLSVKIGQLSLPVPEFIRGSSHVPAPASSLKSESLLIEQGLLSLEAKPVQSASLGFQCKHSLVHRSLPESVATCLLT